MRTETCGLVGTLLVLLVDMTWAFSGPIGWGHNGECVGNTQLWMTAKIVRAKEERPIVWSVSESALVVCANVNNSTEQYEIRVKWSWETESSTTQKPTSIEQNSKTPESKKTTTAVVDTTSTTKTASTKANDTVPTTPSPPPAKPVGKRASHLLEIMNYKDLESTPQQLGTSTKETFSTTDESSTEASTSTSLQSEASTRNPDEGTTGFSTARSGTIVATSTTAASSITDLSTVTVGSTSTTDVTSTDINLSSATTSATDETTAFGLSELRLSESLKVKTLETLEEASGLPCSPHCDVTASRPHEDMYENCLTITLTKQNSLYHVSEVSLQCTLPDDKIFQKVFWKNVDLFPGPVEATHVCEDVTKLSLNDRTHLELQNVKLAAFLPTDHIEFPEALADCNSKYEKGDGNNFCKTAEVIMITVGALLGILLFAGFSFYIGKLYCKSRRERVERDTLP